MPESVQLRDLRLEDLETVMVWAKDSEFCLANDWSLELSEQRIRTHWTGIITESSDTLIRKGITFNAQLIGYTDLADINQFEARASLGYAIGNSSLWGIGLGFHGAKLMLELAFTKLKLERVTAEVNAANTRSLRVLEKLGFKLEGILRQHETYRGMRGDVHLFRMLRQEYWANCVVQKLT
jgi:[ribosomal protein S5]-alanine N-acetyltransferase